MMKRLTLGCGVAVLVAGATLGGMAVAGDGNDREAGATAVAGPFEATKAGPTTRAGGATIQTFYLPDQVVPGEGDGLVTGLDCPRGNAISGGAATDEGIVVSYLSQLRPSQLGVSKKRYWVGVDDNSTENEGAGAYLEVHCARGLRVKK